MAASVRALAALALACLLPVSPLRAQGGAMAGVRGTVTDSAGRPVAAAQVTLRHLPTGQSTAVTADSHGRYLILDRAPGGPYTLRVEGLGFADAPERRLLLVAGTVHQQDFQLGGGVLQLPAIDVGARAETRFGQERSGAATVLDRAAVAAHPSIQRDVMELVALSPMSARTEHGYTIAGQNTRYNTFQIDGARFQDLFGLGGDGVPGGLAHARPLPLQAVEQFQVLVAPFDVRHSGFTGGLLNAVTRSGTNRWEASAFAHYRDQHFLGNLTLADGSLDPRPDHFDNTMAGITIGGPIAADRAHIFAALELERRTAPGSGYHVGRASPFATALAPDSVAAMVAILGQQLGFDAGEAGQFPLDYRRDNAFVRADWQPRTGQRLMLRHNYAAARRDLEPARGPTGAYELGSQAYEHGATAHATSLQLVSSLPRGWSNELLASVQRTRDETTPATTLPIVEVDIVSALDDLRVLRTVRAGGHFEAQANDLTQSAFELRNTLTGAFGAHLFTFGAAAEWLTFRSRFIPNPNGLYRYSSLDSLRLDRPRYFERTVLEPGSGDGSTAFDVAHLSTFLQDEWHATGRLTLRAGVRLDLPVIRDRPQQNPALLASELGINTATLPAAQPTLSPRFAFNWLRGTRLRTQLRGGIGVFTGRPSYAWLASAFAQTGLTTRTLVCEGAQRAPRVSAGAPPAACADGARPGDVRIPAITAFAADFRYPQDLRIAFGFDQSLPGSITLTGDAVYARALRQVHLRDRNLVSDPIEGTSPALGWSDGYGYHERNAYGMPTAAGFEPRRVTRAFGPVIELGEKASNRALALSLELSGLAGPLRYSGGYTFTRAIDSQSLVYRDAATNLGNTVYGTETDPLAAHSDFDRPHRVVASLGASVRRTDLSLFFTAESGTPYTYVYAGDINGDGYPGAGTQDAFNDPVYVIADIAEFPGSLGSGAAYERMIAADPCLQRARGAVLNRNQCRSPATYRLDLRAAHGLQLRRAEVRLIGDLLNLLQLFGAERGLVQRVEPRVPLLQLIGRDPPEFGAGAPERQRLNSWYVGGRAPGGASALLPWTPDLAASRWQAQIGIELRPVSGPR